MSSQHRYFGKAGVFLVDFYGSEEEAQALLNQGYEEYPSKPLSPYYRYVNNSWQLQQHEIEKEDREAAIKELWDIQLEFLKGTLTYLANQPSAPLAIKNLKARLDAVLARINK